MPATAHPGDEDLVSIDAIAKEIDRHRNTVFRMLENQALRASVIVRRGSTTLVKRREFLAHVNAMQDLSTGLDTALAQLGTLQATFKTSQQYVERYLAHGSDVASTSVGLIKAYKDRKHPECQEDIRRAIEGGRKICLAGVSLRAILSPGSPLQRELLRRIESKDENEFELNGIILDPNYAVAKLRANFESGGVSFQDSQLYLDFKNTRSGYLELRRRIDELNSPAKVRVTVLSFHYPRFVLAVSFDQDAGGETDGFLLTENYLLAPLFESKDRCIGEMMPVFKFVLHSDTYKLEKQMFEYMWNTGKEKGATPDEKRLKEVAFGVYLENWELRK
jgi:hypothetical protein